MKAQLNLDVEVVEVGDNIILNFPKDFDIEAGDEVEVKNVWNLNKK